MNLSFFGKIGVILKYIFSSFLSLEMFALSILLFVIMIFNLKKNNRIIQMVIIGVYVGFIIGMFVSYNSYVHTCVDSFIKEIMNYIYFPSTIVYFFIIIFVTGMILYTLFNSKLSMFKKIFNYSFFSILYFFFMSFLSLAAYYSVDVLDTAKLYENETILCLVQVSNFLLLIWILYTGFYHLFLYYKRKYD